MKAVLVNPLGTALRHYTASLERLLVDCGVSVTSIAPTEPSASGQSRGRWLYEYVGALQSARREHSGAMVIQTWPVLGYWDHLISRAILGPARASIVVHDPRPLVHAVGYGRLARRIASLRTVAAAAVVHSKAAFEVVRADTAFRDIVDLPHPMFPPRRPERRPGGRVVISVLGQYKPDRDIEGMERLAAQGPPGWHYRVIGRKWPAIDGWEVANRFIEEDEFDACIRESSAILIPYVRFFQSGVAIRSLEMGTPVVGPRSSSLAELLGSESDWLVTHGSWAQAVRAAIEAGPEEIYRVASSAYRTVLERWRVWTQSMRPIAL